MGHLDLLGMETAFLIVTASSRDFNLSRWFNEKAHNGKIPVRDFDAKIISLSAAMGINQDLEIKRELEISTSPVSLRVVHKICSAGDDANGELLIDLNYLFRLAQEKVDKYLADMADPEDQLQDQHQQQQQEQNQEQDLRSWQDGEYDIEGNLLAASEAYLSDIQAISASGARPASANPGARAEVRGETPEQVMQQQAEVVRRGRYDEVEGSDDPAAAPVLPSQQTPSSPPHRALPSTSLPQPTPIPIPKPKPTPRESGGAFDIRATTSSDWADRLLSAPTPSDRNPTPSERVGRNPIPHTHTRSRSAERYRSTTSSALRSRSIDAEMRRLAAYSHSRVLDAPPPRKCSSSHASAPLPALSAAEEVSGKEVLGFLLRRCVRQADLYHLLQVTLGFLPGYTMVPARGRIVVSTATPWVTAKEVQRAFLSARLPLNALQLHLLGGVLKDFAADYARLYPSEPAPAPEEVPATGPKGFSAAWLRKLLLHLRLSPLPPPSASCSSSAVGAPKAVPGARVSPGPVPWQAWLQAKAMQWTGPYKPQQLKKALLGQPHTLSSADIKMLLTPHPLGGAGSEASGYSEDFEQGSQGQGPAPAAGTSSSASILPEEVLEAELANRAQLWALDADGRRDFQHMLNMKLRSSKAQGHGPSRREDLTLGLMEQKKDELRAAERLEGTISIDLFTSFLKAQQGAGTGTGTGVTWVSWLQAHLQQSAKAIAKLQVVSKQQREAAARQLKRKATMAPLLAVEQGVKQLYTTTCPVDGQHQMQLQKGLVALRRAAEGAGGGAQVVTKEDFDKHIRSVLAPYVSLNETLLEAGEAAPNAWTQAYRDHIVPLFDSDAQQTVSNILAAAEGKEEKNKQKFSSWLADKKHQEEAKKRKAAEDEAKAKESEDKRRTKAEKAYDKWCKLRKRNKYKSKVDNKSHDLPVPRPVEHEARWRKDTEIA